MASVAPAPTEKIIRDGMVQAAAAYAMRRRLPSDVAKKTDAKVIDRAAILRNINNCRKRHGVPPLKWSESCAYQAYKRASHVSKMSPDFGENLARSSMLSWKDPTVACLEATDHWQEEKKLYDYEKPGLSAGTSHFTAIVWKGTTHVGFGAARGTYKGVGFTYVVACFYPKGNIAGEFAGNVLSKGSIIDDGTKAVEVASSNVPGLSPMFVRVGSASMEIKELQSADKRFRFLIKDDGNIVITQGRQITWQSESGKDEKLMREGSCRLVLQANGNLVAFDSSAKAFWTSDTANCGPSPFRLTMQDDGNCVLFDGDWIPHWTTSASQ